jgi:predicted GTPase
VKKYSPPQKGNSPIISPLVNYVEASIELENNVYKLIDTPSFKLHSQTEIEKESKRQTEGLLKESDLILWLVEEINDETFLIKKYLKKIFTPQVLVLNKIDLAVGEENSFS